MRIVVTGWRYWRTPETVERVLSWHATPQDFVGVGDATGADAFTRRWCEGHGVPFREFVANWKDLGKSAGNVRNMYMIDTIRPDLVLAFLHPECRGTFHCVQYAVEHGYEVLRIWA